MTLIALPCPFHHCPPEHPHETVIGRRHNEVFVLCTSCGARGPKVNDREPDAREIAVKAWNDAKRVK